MAINSISAETAISPFSLLPKKKGGNGKIQTNQSLLEKVCME